MFKHKNKVSLVLLFLAVLSFAFFSVGGEFLHSKIHYHKNQYSHDQCFIYQLQVQVLTLQCAIILALFLQFASYLIKFYQIFVFQPHYNLPYSHAPPISR